nr:unnamed protein product [Digitaria exilis]
MRVHRRDIGIDANSSPGGKAKKAKACSKRIGARAGCHDSFGLDADTRATIPMAIPSHLFHSMASVAAPRETDPTTVGMQRMSLIHGLAGRRTGSIAAAGNKQRNKGPRQRRHAHAGLLAY